MNEKSSFPAIDTVPTGPCLMYGVVIQVEDPGNHRGHKRRVVLVSPTLEPGSTGPILCLPLDVIYVHKRHSFFEYTFLVMLAFC